MDTRAKSKAKMGDDAVKTPGSHQNGQHLLGSIQGDDHDELFDQEEAAMLRDGQAGTAPGNFTMNREETGEDEYLTPMQGVRIGATTSPGQFGLIQGLTAGSAGSAGGGNAGTKKFVIEDEDFILAEEMRVLELEVKQYEIKLKRAKVAAMKLELERISPKVSGIPDSRGKEHA